jgi:RNA polymerase sigma-70 factor (ECF subfamily)
VTILNRRFIDACRRRSRAPQQQPLDEAVLPADASDEPREPAPPWSQITAEQVSAALAKLRPSFREVYELATTGNRSYKEIAAELNLPPATVGTRLIRARRKLRVLLTPLLAQAA